MKEWTLFYSGLSGQGHIHSAKQTIEGGDHYFDVVEKSEYTKLKEWKSYYEKKFAAGIFLTNDEYAELHEKIRALELKIKELEHDLKILSTGDMP